MYFEEFRDYCLAKREVSESFPFDQNTLVFKVCNKMFALAGVDNFDYINLKCDPEMAVDLREKYSGIRPGYHMNKQHWNSVYINEDVPRELIFALIDQSYELIVKSLPKKTRNEFKI